MSELERATVSLETLLENSTRGLAVLDRELTVVAANPQWLCKHRMAVGQLVGRPLAQALPEAPVAELAAALDGRPRNLSRRRLVRGDGTAFEAEVKVAPWRTAAGGIGGLIVSIETGEESAAAPPDRHAEERLAAAIDLAGLYVWELDPASGAVWSAGRPDAFFGDGANFESFRSNPWRIVHPDDRKWVTELGLRELQSGGRFLTEYRLNRPEPGVWVRGGCIALPGKTEAEPWRFIGVLQDVTERKLAEIAADRANAAKSDFLARMSHEIRTPLNGVLGLAQAMLADELPEVQRGRLQVLRQSGEALLAILNDILDLSKIEAGKLDIEFTDFDLHALVGEVHANFEALAAQSGVAFEAHLEAPRGLYRGDPMRLRQILSNLVSNALKFTQAGEVVVAVTHGEGVLEIAVRDTGIGIPADKLAHVFDSFSQVDASTTRRYGGTGLGLAICKTLTELMGGTISVESRPGAGSVFRLAAPCVRSADAPAAAAPVAGPALGNARPTLRVLAAEDNRVNQLVLKTLLNQGGVEPTLVEDGLAAVAAFETGDWDLVLMDMQMPRLDGAGAVRRIRELEQRTGRAATPIVALTADAMAHQIAAYLAAGADAHVAKPIDARRLFETLERVLSEPRSARPDRQAG